MLLVYQRHFFAICPVVPSCSNDHVSSRCFEKMLWLPDALRCWPPLPLANGTKTHSCSQPTLKSQMGQKWWWHVACNGSNVHGGSSSSPEAIGENGCHARLYQQLWASWCSSQPWSRLFDSWLELWAVGSHCGSDWLKSWQWSLMPSLRNARSSFLTCGTYTHAQTYQNTSLNSFVFAHRERDYDDIDEEDPFNPRARRAGSQNPNHTNMHSFCSYSSSMGSQNSLHPPAPAVSNAPMSEYMWVSGSDVWGETFITPTAFECVSRSSSGTRLLCSGEIRAMRMCLW